MAALAGIGARIRPTGWLKVYESVRAFEQARAGYEAMRQLGVPWEELGPDEIRAREPALAPIFARAVFHDLPLLLVGNVAAFEHRVVDVHAPEFLRGVLGAKHIDDRR